MQVHLPILQKGSMKTWRQALIDGIGSGAVASIVSTLALASRGQRENGTPYGTTNAISRWVWGDRAIQKDGKSVRYTAIGYLIHHATSTLWAVMFEKWFGQQADRGKLIPALSGAVVVSGLACYADYKIAPYRLQPGFNRRLSSSSLAMVYGSIVLALVATSVIRASHRRYQ